MCVFLIIGILSLFAACLAESTEITTGNTVRDQVVFDNGVYTVYASEATYILDMSRYKSFLCFTQDTSVSGKFYRLRPVNDPEQLSQNMASNHAHFLIYDIETGLTILISLKGRSQQSIKLQDLNLLSEEELRMINAQDNTQVFRIGERNWIYYPVTDPENLYTFYNGFIININFGGSNDHDMDLEDTKELLIGLKLQEPKQ